MTERSLGPLERRIMTHLWQTGTGTVAQVLAAANTGDARPLAYTTVMTVLVRLHEKGLVARVREGRQFRYAPAVQEDQLTAELGRRESSIGRPGRGDPRRAGGDLYYARYSSQDFERCIQSATTRHP